eukprot:CAMPEP_0113477032 /NCGR_PEP_ID=MMETSP0014_2-20120614/19990_1 /TAXON_ID=2857 /ORGANISM="Nitzschia sp." /LENGTH=797 /DNA_ID=CAMNT_0000370097 /DNA_START=561 /DNA_END=2954 /DNA_ORIENTATION=+ /assembly_acc=CAM_ASM_000159
MYKLDHSSVSNFMKSTIGLVVVIYCCCCYTNKYHYAESFSLTSLTSSSSSPLPSSCSSRYQQQQHVSQSGRSSRRSSSIDYPLVVRFQSRLNRPRTVPSTTITHVASKDSISDTSSSSSSDLKSDRDDIVSSSDNVSSSSSSSEETVSKFRQLKDIMWIRETLEDLTAAEFALSVESETATTSTTMEGSSFSSSSSSSSSSAQQLESGSLSSSGSSNSSSSSIARKKKRAVDYEKLLGQLTTRVEDMTCEMLIEAEDMVTDDENSNNNDDDGEATAKKTTGSKSTISVAATSMPLELKENKGMGRFVYSEDQREALLERIVNTRNNLKEVIKGHLNEDQEGEGGDESLFIKLPEIPDLNATAFAAGPKLYVRDDGTVDWEGALQDRAALRKFGGAVWARINGQTPDDFDGDEDEDEDESSDAADKKQDSIAGAGHGEKPKVTVEIEETAAIKSARAELERLQAEYKEKQKAHTALLSSGISAGQPVANVRLAALPADLRNKIRFSAEELLVMEQQVSYQNLVYDLERIYTYLSAELGNPSNKGYIPLQDRLNVAEYGLLESQAETCSKDLDSKGLLDADILAVIVEQMTDFKRRLGIDYYVAGLSFDQEAIQRWLNDLLINSLNGLMFYVKGTKLFWNDLVYCFDLIGRAAQGFTLEPRQVRTLRRTVKDLFTFIPVIIIWIIPLTPVGHVLVFGAIQRFFPDFFPSCFTEQRQNLLQLYESTEFSEFTIKETPQERITRFFEFIAFFVASKTRNFYKVLTEGQPEEKERAILGVLLTTLAATGIFFLKRQTGVDVA